MSSDAFAARRDGFRQRTQPQRLTSSIPSKHTTIPRHEARSRDGFGTRTARFSDQENSSSLGPGAYEGDRSFVWDHDSLSSKGYGAFVSKQKRMQAKVVYTGPGPGQYGNEVQHTMRDFNRAPMTAVFQKAQTIRNAPDETEELTPGPGTYELHRTRCGREMDWLKDDCKSAFLAIPRDKHGQPLCNIAPAPGAYELTRSWNAPEEASTLFKKSCGRRGLENDNSKGTPGIVLGPSPTQEEGLTPGPGSYEISQVNTIEDNLRKNRTNLSSMFVTANDPDRSASGARRSKKPLPGPGAYDLVPQASQALQTSISSSFVSKVPRGDQPTKSHSHNAPGPAFYRTSLPGRKSFHLNARRRFVPYL